MVRGEARWRGGGERNWDGLILTIQSETAKVFSFVTSSGYVLLVTNSVQKNCGLNPGRNSLSCVYLFSAYHAYYTETIFILFSPGSKDQRTQDLYQSNPIQQETAPGTASCQNATKHRNFAEGA